MWVTVCVGRVTVFVTDVEAVVTLEAYFVPDKVVTAVTVTLDACTVTVRVKVEVHRDVEMPLALAASRF
jgi:hypothetical protein